MLTQILKALLLVSTVLAEKNQFTNNYVLDGGLDIGTRGGTSKCNKIEVEMIDQGGPRLYMVDSSKTKYQMFDLNNVKFSVDVDLSKIPCGYNFALYFVEMPETAKPGTGYCDAQGVVGGLCAELDIVEGNKKAFAFTNHACAGGNCDKGGIGTKGVLSELGLDPEKPFRAISTFKDGSMEQMFTQDGKVVPGVLKVADKPGQVGGGFAEMSKAYSRGMVLTISLWTTGTANGMEWLDGGCSPFQSDYKGVKGAFSKMSITPL